MGNKKTKKQQTTTTNNLKHQNESKEMRNVKENLDIANEDKYHRKETHSSKFTQTAETKKEKE